MEIFLHPKPLFYDTRRGLMRYTLSLAADRLLSSYLLAHIDDSSSHSDLYMLLNRERKCIKNVYKYIKRQKNNKYK